MYIDAYLQQTDPRLFPVSSSSLALSLLLILNNDDTSTYNINIRCRAAITHAFMNIITEVTYLFFYTCIVAVYDDIYTVVVACGLFLIGILHAI